MRTFQTETSIQGDGNEEATPWNTQVSRKPPLQSFQNLISPNSMGSMLIGTDFGTSLLKKLTKQVWHLSLSSLGDKMATKNFIVSFERDSKTINRSLLQNFYICFTSGDILT